MRKIIKVISLLVFSVFFCVACKQPSPPLGDSEDVDIKKRFCEWYFTSNMDGRWERLQEAMNAIQTEQLQENTQTTAGLVLTEQSPDVEDSIEAYFSPVRDITDEAFRNKMLLNRDPFKYDQLLSEAGASSTLQDVEFTFYSTLDSLEVYEFKAHLLIHNYKQLEENTVIETNDGQLEIAGQITTEKGLVKKIYLSSL